MTDEAFVRQRRCLNIISIAIIVYFTAGIELSRDGFAGIVVTDGIIAGTFVWIAFFYFWWRFQLYGAEVQKSWRLEFLLQLCKNEKYRRLYEQPEDEAEANPGQTVWAPALRAEGFRRYLSWEKAYLVGVRTADGTIQFAGRETFADTVNPDSQRWNVGSHTTVPIGWRRYVLPALKANVLALGNRSGTDWALPNFLACMALICGIVALIIRFA